VNDDGLQVVQFENLPYGSRFHSFFNLVCVDRSQLSPLGRYRGMRLL
jgi:hypothetical protein